MCALIVEIFIITGDVMIGALTDKRFNKHCYIKTVIFYTALVLRECSIGEIMSCERFYIYHRSLFSKQSRIIM